MSTSVTATHGEHDWSACKSSTVYYCDESHGSCEHKTRDYYALCQQGGLVDISEEYAKELMDEDGWKGPTKLPLKN